MLEELNLNSLYGLNHASFYQKLAADKMQRYSTLKNMLNKIAVTLEKAQVESNKTLLGLKNNSKHYNYRLKQFEP